LILAIYALVDCVQTPSGDVRVLPKLAWMALIVLPVLGPVLWLVFGRDDSVVRRLLFPAPTGGPAPGPRRALAPDDDPDFLRGLAQGSARPRGTPPTRRTTRDEDALLDEWERDLRRKGPDPRQGSESRAPDPRPAPPVPPGQPTDQGAEREDPDDEGPEGSTDGAPRV
jgi:hypothetical protein